MEEDSKLRRALRWLRDHRVAVLAVAVSAVPLVARLAPWFPSEEVLSALRILLGA
ncbi:hypothetical protein OH723_24255 [Streptomyces albidoflavus]|uniref:hypothetical protein n=1 Tax=Streptomyces albidoflavus TaxID=1886 RepID=UPI003867B5A2|nr:hypothetical protein OH723_24255 [Streptomyces albidoflavus]